MGLDFYVEKRRKGSAYEGESWEEIAYGRNCYTVRDVVFHYVDRSQDPNDYIFKVGYGTLNKIVKGLIDEAVLQRDFNDKENMVDDSYTKTLLFASELAKGLVSSAIDYEYENAEYDYRIINSY